MGKIEVTGKTVSDAVTEACIKLQTSSDRVAYEVVEQGSSGILGLFAKPAKILAWVKSDAELAEDKRQEAAAKKAQKIAAQVQAKTQTTSEKGVRTQTVPQTELQAKAQTAQKQTKVQNTVRKQGVQAQTAARTMRKEAPKETVRTEQKSESKVERRQLTHEEIEQRVTDFLQAMFQAIGLKETLTFTYEPDNTVIVDMEGDDAGIMIGKRGQTLDSLQYLTSLVVNKGHEKYIRVKLDTENYRHRREETLKNLAHNMASKAKRTGHAVELEPMNPYERRIIHAALQGDRYVSTKSEGEDPYRHVVIFVDRNKAGDGASWGKKEEQ